MSLTERLKRLDDQVLPASLKGSYDSPRPLWLLYAGLVNAVSAVIFVVGLERAHGTERLLLCLVVALAFIGNTVAALRWDRAHRLGGART